MPKYNVFVEVAGDINRALLLGAGGEPVYYALIINGCGLVRRRTKWMSERRGTNILVTQYKLEAVCVLLRLSRLLTLLLLARRDAA